MDISGNIQAANRNHVSWINAQRVDKAQSARVQNSPVMQNIANVSGKQTVASEFHAAPSQTNLALDHVKKMAWDGTPQALQDAKLSYQAEPLKSLLGIIAENVSPQDKPKFNSICERLINAKGKPKREQKVADDIKLLMHKYGQASLNKFISDFTEDCREAWRQNHTGFGASVADELIFNTSLLACQDMLTGQINTLTDPDAHWINIGQYAKFFEFTCAAVSKTLINHKGQEQNTKPADTPNNTAPRGTDVQDSPNMPNMPNMPSGLQGSGAGNGTQYTIPAGQGHGPITINAYGGTATATANNAPADNSGGVKAPTNQYDFGIALLKNMPKDELQADLIKDYMNRVMPQVSSVSNSDASPTKASATHSGMQSIITDNVYSVYQQPGQAAGDIGADANPYNDSNMYGASGEVSGQSGQVSTGLLDELLMPPQTSGDGETKTQTGNGDQIDLQDNSDTESLYDASRQVADALSDMMSELGSPPTSPVADDTGAFFSDQIEQLQSSSGRVAMQTMDGSDMNIEDSSQENFGEASVSNQSGLDQASMRGETAALSSPPRPQFATDAPAIKPQNRDGQANMTDGAQGQRPLNAQVIRENLASASIASSEPVGNTQASQVITGRSAQEQAAVNGKVMGEESINTASITSPTAGKGFVSNAIAQWEKRANGQQPVAQDAEIVSENLVSASTVTSQPVNRLSAQRATTGRVQAQPAAEQQALTGNGANSANDSGRVMQPATDGAKRAGDQEPALQGNNISGAAVSTPAHGNSRSADGVKRNGQQPAVQQNVMQEPEADAATTTTPARGKGSVMNSIAAFESRATEQRQANERLASQRGSGMDSFKARNNANGGNINYGKDFFQPLKGVKGNNGGYSSHPVYTTSRTIDPFSRVNAPGSSFVKQFNQFEVNASDRQRLNSVSDIEE